MRTWVLTAGLVAVLVFLIVSHVIQWRQGTFNMVTGGL